jgi:hypothetical protein
MSGFEAEISELLVVVRNVGDEDSMYPLPDKRFHAIWVVDKGTHAGMVGKLEVALSSRILPELEIPDEPIYISSHPLPYTVHKYEAGQAGRAKESLDGQFSDPVPILVEGLITPRWISEVGVRRCDSSLQPAYPVSQSKMGSAYLISSVGCELNEVEEWRFDEIRCLAYEVKGWQKPVWMIHGFVGIVRGFGKPCHAKIVCSQALRKPQWVVQAEVSTVIQRNIS